MINPNSNQIDLDSDGLADACDPETRITQKSRNQGRPEIRVETVHPAIH